jgi:murein DD-endopeptidase MepM/ murein hydrolase activator NlpD
VVRERQIIIHDGVHVRRFTLRRWHQLGVLLLLAAYAGWGVTATAVYVDGQENVAQRNGEITRRVAELDGIKANYRAAFSRLDEFQSLFTNITCEIGNIQNSLLRVAERTAPPDRRSLVPRKAALEPSPDCAAAAAAGHTAPAASGPRISEAMPPAVPVAAPDVAAATAAAGDGAAVPVTVNASADSSRIVGALQSSAQQDVQVRVSQLSAALERLRQTHGAFLRQSADLAAKRVGALEKALSRVGVDASQLGATPAHDKPEGVPSQFGSGGPFVPMPKGAAAGTGGGGKGGSFDPIALFNSHADRLDSLIIAMRALPLAQPLDEYEITSPFGSRDDPFNEQSAFHEGVDFGAPLNSPVLATGDGVVVSAGWRDKYGIMVEIDHGRGLSTRYAHLSRALVHPGDHVTRGRPIGLLGNTGRSTGPHLHYEVRVNDQPTDPMKFIMAGRDVLKNE